MKIHLYRRLLPLLLLATVAVLPSSAQEGSSTAPAADVETPSPAAQARPALTLPPGRPEAARPRPAEPEAQEPENMIETLVLVDDSALQVLDLLEQMTDKIVLRSGNLAQVKINFDSRGPISEADAVLALESLLTLNGIMLTDMGGRFMKAVPATDVNRHVPEMIIGTTLDRPSSQQIYAKIFPLEYLNVEQAAGTIINPLLSPNSNSVAFPKSNAILVTDALINLQRIERILTQADQAQSIHEEIHFVKLSYVQAREMQERIQNLIQGPLKRYLEGNTSVTADERSNQLIVVTPKGNFDTLMRVIESIDVDAAPLTASEVFPLRQAKAEEVVPMIEKIISGQKEGREADAKIARENQRTGGGNNRAPENAPQPEIPGQPAAPAPTPAAGVAATTSDVNASLQFSNFVGLSADERTNSIVAYGTHSDLKTLKDLIDKIDIHLPQVRIEAIITEVTLSENQASGIETLGLFYNGEDLVFGIDVDNPNRPSDPLGAVGGILAPGFSIKGNSTGVFSAVLRASEGDNNVRVLSVPSIVVSHNEEGVINVSESRPIITGSTSSLQDNNSTNVRSNVEFRDIGIQLTVTPLIGADGSVQMKVEQRVDNLADTVTIDGNEQPVIGVREATSTITVDSGQVTVLGGLQQNRRSEGHSYFPLVGRLPVIKKVFGGENKEFVRTELVIFIRPTVLTSRSEREKMSTETIKTTPEGEAVEEFLEEGTTGRLYMEGSRFETPEEDEPKERPFIRWGWNRDDN